MERSFAPGELFGVPAYADVTIKFSGRQLRAQKVILGMRSKYFERAFAEDGGFKEGKEGVLELHDDNPDALESMLRYIYSSEYPSIQPKEWGKHLELAVVADKYGLVQLKDKTLQRLHLVATFQTITETLTFVSRVGTEFPGKQDQVGKLITKHCNARFKDCFRDESFRKLLDCNPLIRDKLCLKHITELVGTPGFSTMLEEDSKLASKYLEGLVRLHQEHFDECWDCPYDDDD